MLTKRWETTLQNRFFRWSQRYPILLPLVIVFTFVGTLEYAVDASLQGHDLLARTRTASARIADHVSIDLAGGSAPVTVERLRADLSGWTHREPDIAISVQDGDGRELLGSVGSSAHPDRATFITEGDGPGALGDGQRIVVQVERPLALTLRGTDATPPLSTARRVVVLHDISAELAAIYSEVRWKSALRALVYAGMLGLTWMLFNGLVGRRIKPLIDTARPAGSGRIDAGKSDLGHDEIESLARAVSARMQELESQQGLLTTQSTALHASNAELLALRTAIDLHAIVSMADLAGNIVFANDKFCAISGFSRAELLGQNHRILNSGTHPPAFFAELWGNLTAGKSWHGEIQNRTKQGKSYWVQSTILPIRGSGDQADYYLSIRTDSTRQARLRAGLEIIASVGHEDSVLERLVEGVAMALDVCCAAIGVLRADRQTVDMVAHWFDGGPAPLLSYLASASLCVELLQARDNDVHAIEGDAINPAMLHPFYLDRGIVSYRGCSLKDANGKIVGLLFVGDDKSMDDARNDRAVLSIAARRAQAELIMAADVKVLRDYRRQMELAVGVANLEIWYWDIATDHCEITVSGPTWQAVDVRWHGDGRTRLQVVAPEDRVRYRAALTEHLAGRTESFVCQFQVESPAGRRVLTDRGQVVERDGTGRALRMLGVVVDDTEQIQHQAQLNQERARVESAVEGAGLGIWDLDLETGHFETDDRWWRMFDTVPGEFPVTFETWGARFHPDDPGLFRTHYDDYLSGRAPRFAVEYRHRVSDRHWLWILVSGKITRRTADGTPAGMSGIVMDITERKLAEARALDREQKMKLVVHAGRTGFWEWFIDADEIDLHEEMFGLLDPSVRKLITGAEWTARLEPEDRERYRQRLVGHLKGQTPDFECEIRYRSTERGELNILSRGEVVERDVLGRALRMVGVHVDITQLRTAEHALKQRSLDFEFVAAAANVGIWDWDIEGKVLAANAQVRLMLGYPAEHEVNPEVWLADILHPADLPKVLEAQRRCVRGEISRYSIEVRFKAVDGAWVWVLGTGWVAARSEAGRATRMLGIHLNINDLKLAANAREQLERQLQQAQKMEALGQLTGGIAHDFNNILASVLGYSELARSRFAGDDQPKLREYLDAVIQSSERARDLVAKMLAYSRSTPAEAPSALVVAPVLREVMGMLHSVIPSSVQIVCEIEDETATVMFDPTELHQGMINLAINARDAMDGVGRIVIRSLAPRFVEGGCTSCRRTFSGEFVEISVADSGPGISPEHLERLFDPFFTTKPVGKGTGLGLSVVHGVMHRGAGHVVVESRPGFGATFRLLFVPRGSRTEGEPVPTVAARQ